MYAIWVSKGTKYACNLKSKTDHICLQFLSTGTKYVCKHWNLFSCDLSRNHSRLALGQFSLLQAYLVPVERNCKHIWSVLDLRLHPYYIPIVIMIARLFSPLGSLRGCKHVSYSSIYRSFRSKNGYSHPRSDYFWIKIAILGRKNGQLWGQIGSFQTILGWKLTWARIGFHLRRVHDFDNRIDRWL